MTHPRATLRRAAMAGAALAALVLAMPPASAQPTDASATVRLIQLLIDKGVLTREQAADLLKQAQDEGRAPAKAKARPPAATPTATPEPLAAAEPPPPPAVPPGTVRVTYVPQVVRDQIAGEVRQQVMQQAQAEGWAAPNTTPEWTRRVRIYGDVRVRGQGILEDKSKNNNTLIDFNNINNGTAFDTASGANPPFINTTQNRTAGLVRARMGVMADINDWTRADIRFGTGNDNSPVSGNQTLGNPGNFSKYAAWLDRAYLKLSPFRSMEMYLGRAPNPFWTSDLLFYDDLGFDGASVKASFPLNGMLDVFASAGAFSVFNTSFSFSTFNQQKFQSHDKYLFAGQVGAEARPLPDLTAKAAVGFFAFTNIDGKLSRPCLITQSTIGCSTDATRAQFLQYGNTLYAIRNVLQTAASSANPQYFGLASRFDILDLHGRVSYAGLRVPVSLEGDFSKNLGFNRKLIASRVPVNNFSDAAGTWRGGDTGYLLKVTVGKPEIKEKWDWNVFAAYKYLESDAVLDALNDPNFHLGGTNAKGTILGGSLGVGHNLALTTLWYSATQISGPPYSNDVVQVELSARF